MPVFDTPLTTNDQSLERVLNAGLPVALVFYDSPLPAALDEALKAEARLRAGKLLVAKINTAENPAAAQRYSQGRRPELITFKDNREFSRAEGLSAAALAEHSAYLLGEGPKPQTPPANGRSQAAQAPSQTATAGKPEVVTDASFERAVLRAAEPVLVDFWAPWCGPCRMVEPVVERLAHEYAGRLKVAKVNVDENPQIAGQYGIQSIPTMFIVKGGQIVDRWMGALPEPAIRSRVQAHV